jgi:Asp-tRNA(Asn)/Glu-tRNA(Gln) amidotransferase A subunit family amidase
MQLLGPAWSEDNLCELGAAIEARSKWNDQRPPIAR